MVSSNNRLDTDYARNILFALQSKLIYLGSVPTREIEKRRQRNRVAADSRKANRQNGSGH